MKFGPVPVAEAEGGILAHSIALTKGRLRKGLQLSAADIATLSAEGHQLVTVAQLEPGDMAEDEAAEQLATALIGDALGLRKTAAATGRVNIYATRPGIVALDEAALQAFNAVNPMITVATLPQHMRVDPGTMVATIKIIAYAVPGADVDQAAGLAPGAIAQRAPVLRTATLIETVQNGATPLKGRAALETRLAWLDVALTDPVVVAHDIESVASAIARAPGEAVFILTASATSDVADVGPAGLVAAEGQLVQFGMPVDPGNLLFLGALGAKPVIGLPGCARSPALNGADWVMERVLCGVDLTPADFARMGVGGLLKEIPTRPKPRGDIEG
ncbi:molybdopterin-binding protein [Cognatiyoonia sp. IB215446]|uniref:molybdopterin-binding protein n=1 Tax=Cognatiyoonia sp. IB215446 TaxID=3097355 RepID=UPI002A1146FD|nr:molybdopterin-binding protein [Cognatiyoonia sp. IB215446]MDX8348518.1 molybdopterin-binding protein [Cognatiyoonia sp. IB215446]